MSCSAASVHFLTLGCPKNEVDSDVMRAAVAASDYRVAEQIGDADIVVVNTCSFIQEATEESIAAVLDVASSWLPERAGRRLVVAGCMASRYGDELAAEFPEVDAFVPVAEEGALIEVLDRLSGTRSDVSRAPQPISAEPPARLATGPAAYVQVSDGCHRSCSFCTIPSIRGPYRSRPLPGLIEEVRSLVSQGVREITLVGQDISSYGRDLGASAPTLADVVRSLARVEGVDWLRLMYVQPDGVTDELLRTMATEPAVCHYLDIPLQHASASVLRRMRRSGSPEEFLALLGRVREWMPDAVLRTSIIAGFPGETRADVAALEDFLVAARLDYVGVFAYSPEEGTPAALSPDSPTRETRIRRANRVRELADRIGTEKAAARIGDVLEVLVEGTDDGVAIGRWRGQAPEVDGIVSLDRGEAGDLVRARVVDTLGYDLEAEVL